MNKVLVLDANQRSSLAIIRSLGRHGLTVVAGDHKLKSIGAASKYAATSVQYPNPAYSCDAFHKEIVAIVNRLGIDTVIPATDLTTMLLISQPNLAEIVHLIAPPAASYESLTNKANLFALAEALDIPAPKTLVADTTAGITSAAHEIGFPVVIKPARSRYLKNDAILSTGVQIVKTPAALADVLRHQKWLGDIPALVQKFVPGHGAGIFSLYSPSGPIAWFAHRRIREKPPTGGVSVLSESVPVDPIMQKIATRLLSAANWLGVAMIEFRIAEDGTPYLMEVNGRFWGSLQLAIDCGVDFPWLLYQLMVEHYQRVTADYSTKRRLRWLLGDFDNLIITLRSAQYSLAHKSRSLRDFIWSFADPSCRQEVLRFPDILPGFREIQQWIGF